MPAVIFEEIECKEALNRVQAPGLPFRWALNPYRGCQHACVYCFARQWHEHLGYDPGKAFEERVVVKTNVHDALRALLRRGSWKRETVGIGTACDPYQQAEVKYELTRKCLRELAAAATPTSIVTKSPLVTRDIDILQEIGTLAAVSVALSVPTVDEGVWKQTEPATAHPRKRLEAVERLTEAGIEAGVLLAPIIPGITDSRANLEQVVAGATDHKAAFLGSNVLYLKPGTREWFMPFLREAYPHLETRYADLYQGPYAPRSYTQEVLAMVRDLRDKWRLGDGVPKPEPRGQMALI
jgi:DNA repair photolyase